MDNLADILIMQGEFADAEPVYQKAMAIAKEMYGPEHGEVARYLDNLAVLLRAPDRNLEGDDCEARAWAIRARASGEGPKK